MVCGAGRVECAGGRVFGAVRDAPIGQVPALDQHVDPGEASRAAAVVPKRIKTRFVLARLERDAELEQLGRATGGDRLATGELQRGQEDRDEQGDDADHDQKFRKRETPPPPASRTQRRVMTSTHLPSSSLQLCCERDVTAGATNNPR